MKETLLQFPAKVTEFTVAPQIQTKQGELPYHEWLMEFEQAPENLGGFAKCLDEVLRAKNTYYNDLISGGILQPLKITLLQPKAFQNYMKAIGKLGGQNKTPRLGNNREIAEALQVYRL